MLCVVPVVVPAAVVALAPAPCPRGVRHRHAVDVADVHHGSVGHFGRSASLWAITMGRACIAVSASSAKRHSGHRSDGHPARIHPSKVRLLQAALDPPAGSNAVVG